MMRKIVFKNGFSVLCFLALTFAASLILSYEALAQHGLTKIADNVYSYVDTKNSSPKNSFGANAGIIIGKDSIVVIDTLISSKEAKRFIKDIRAITKKPIKYIINTHYHLDHTFGNSEFAKLGAVIISHTNDNKNLKTHGETALKNAKNYRLSEQDMKGTKIAYPSLIFNDRMEIDLGGQKIELIYIGHSHTDGSILAYLPDKKVLFTGDILFTNYHPFIGDGNIEEWVKGLDYIMTMDVEKIIPGHGPISNKKDIEDMKNYLIAFDMKAKELAEKSNDVEYIVAEIKKSLPPRPEGDNLIPWNIQMKYLKK
jgi:glyoxylase-like metal-dependent hydrolase (beta-lactamase superfamily II)